jgi:S-adenosyl-L-methionine hydrolase (adenosine-forming)
VEPVPIVTFLSDYGLDDPFVGICHAMVARTAPRVRVIDLTHGVPKHDVAVGSVLLADCVPHLPPPVTLAVVDPGVGTARRAVAAAAEGPGGPHWFVGPDNGLLAPALAVLGGAVQAIHLAEPAGVSATFHGRDVFAPAAARLADGAQPDELGGAIDPGGLCDLALPRPQVSVGRLETVVLSVDRFGNLALAASPEDLRDARFRTGQWLALTAYPGGTRAARLARAFADVAEGHLVVLVDSNSRVAVAVRGASAAERLEAKAGTRMTLSARGMPAA